MSKKKPSKGSGSDARIAAMKQLSEVINNLRKRVRIYVFHIDKVKQGQYGFEFSGCMFKLLRVREKTVLVRSNKDEEGYDYPYDVHEFPKEIGTIVTVKPFP